MYSLNKMSFWTGFNAIPPCGFDSNLTVDFYEAAGRRLPSAATCSMTLWLPRNVSDPDELWNLLKDAIHMSAGFGKI